jgi:hypothetical protein
MDELLGTAKKIPTWGWVAAGVAAGVLVLWQQYQARNAPAAATDTTTTTATSPTSNTDTPSGQNPCATYQTPNCTPPDFVIFEADQFGCPMPVCASSLVPGNGGGNGSGTGSGVTCHVVQHGEFLAEIAAAAGTPGGYQQLVAWNKVPNACGPGYPSLALNPNLIQPGWDLRVL